MYFFSLASRGVLTLTLFVRIVEFASQEDSQRAIRELSEQPLLGRPVFIREVRSDFLFHFIFDLDLFTNTGSGERVALWRYTRSRKNRYGNGWSRSHRWTTTSSGVP
jgi:RNA recognition motif-containing protein